MIDVSRSSAIFPPGSYKDDIHIIGVGATGSHLAVELITHGINGSQINVYDFDKVEEHNIANQLYTIEHIGIPKVNALEKIIRERYNENIKAHNTKLSTDAKLKGVVFLLVDTFEDRRNIFKGMQYKPDVKLVVETRLAPRIAIVNTMDARNIEHVKYFHSELEGLDDNAPDVEVSACGTRQTVGSTVRILSAMAAQEFFKWASNRSHIGNMIYLTTDWQVYTEKIKYKN